MIVPVHQDPADLVLTIVAGKIETPLTVLKQASLERGSWRLNFHIIGESHLVTVEYNGLPVLSEVLACVDITASHTHQQHFNDLAEHTFSVPGYTVLVDFDSSGNEVRPLASVGTLEMEFPEIDGQIPLTRVSWSPIGETAFRWQTLHVYPIAGKRVCVQSFSYLHTGFYALTNNL